MVRLVKRINLREMYPEIYGQVLVTMLTSARDMLDWCNEDTVHIPIQTLSYLAQIDETSTSKFLASSQGFMSALQKLYERYQHDGLLDDDIVDLIKIMAAVSGNSEFASVFVA